MEEDNSTSFGMVFFGGGTLLAVGVVVVVAVVLKLGLLLLVAVPDIPCFLVSVIVAVVELGWAELCECSGCGGGGCIYIYMSVSLGWVRPSSLRNTWLVLSFAVAMEIHPCRKNPHTVVQSPSGPNAC
jgi:hypothetical protein